MDEVEFLEVVGLCSESLSTHHHQETTNLARSSLLQLLFPRSCKENGESRIMNHALVHFAQLSQSVIAPAIISSEYAASTIALTHPSFGVLPSIE